MNSKMLKNMISSRDGGMKAFSKEVGIANSTLFNSLSSDSQLSHMPIGNFMKIAHALGYTADELLEIIDAD